MFNGPFHITFWSSPLSVFVVSGFFVKVIIPLLTVHCVQPDQMSQNLGWHCLLEQFLVDARCKLVKKNNLVDSIPKMIVACFLVESSKRSLQKFMP